MQPVLTHKDGHKNCSPKSRRHRSFRDTWRSGLDVICQRWTNAMPKFFRRVCWISALVGGTALAVNTAITSGGGMAHEWWQDIYPYLIGIPAGAAFVAKFTQNYDKYGNPIRKPREQENNSVIYNESDMEVKQPTMRDVTTPAEPSDIEPYNGD